MNSFLSLFFRDGTQICPSDFKAYIPVDNPTIFEVGCNDGSHTLEFLKTFPQCSLYCFEPDTRAASRFISKVKSSRVSFFPFAIGSVDGTTRFFSSGGNPFDTPHPDFPEDWDLSGSIHPPSRHLEEMPRITFAAKQDVQIRRLDSVTRDLGLDKIDLIWADVQGAEADLICGARQTLKTTRYFFTEFSDRELYSGQINLRQMRALLPDFKLVKKLRHDVLFRNRNLP